MRILGLLIAIQLAAIVGYATEIRIMQSEDKLISRTPLKNSEIIQLVRNEFDVDAYRSVRVRPTAQGDLLVYLFSPKYHTFNIKKLVLDTQNKIVQIQHDFKITKPVNWSKQNATTPTAVCPDPTVEFIALCPNDVEVELKVTHEVAEAARAHGLKTVELLKEDATKKAYLNYMSCPNLKGNFYDGDSNPNLMITYDDDIYAEEYTSILGKSFRFKVTNIWLACQAYNDPMLSNVITGAQAQKFAAGVNDLLVGPSDEAAACTMKAAIEGKAISTSFDDCYKQFDTPEDHWGLGGSGSDFFGQ